MGLKFPRIFVNYWIKPASTGHASCCRRWRIACFAA